MKVLEKEFEKGGFKHKQIKRERNVAIYERWKGNQTPHFEIVVIKELGDREIFGRSYEASEVYPSSSNWGQTGFTHHDLESANKKFHELLNRPNEQNI